jgi:hypothetical protein
VAASGDVWVIDTSSLLGVREQFGKSNETKLLSSLDRLVEAAVLFFPPEVLAELERGSAAGADPPLLWARRNRGKAEKKADWETVKAVLRVAPDVLDPDIPDEQADPYVVALGIDLQGLGIYQTTIVTDDRKDKPTKLSLATAAGMLGLPTVPLHAFLRSLSLRK